MAPLNVIKLENGQLIPFQKQMMSQEYLNQEAKKR
jgi:hypothetical protein